MSRADDVILSAGYRIGSFEVESALIEHPAVAASAGFSSPDDARGVVKAVTAPYPRRLEFVDNLLKTVSGEICRIELRTGVA